MKDDQVTLRVDRTIAAALERQAKLRGVPKSQVVREALAAYLVGAPADDSAAAWDRVVPMVGSLALDRAAIDRDALARQLRAHNWRK